MGWMFVGNIILGELNFFHICFFFLIKRVHHEFHHYASIINKILRSLFSVIEIIHFVIKIILKCEVYIYVDVAWVLPSIEVKTWSGFYSNTKAAWAKEWISKLIRQSVESAEQSEVKWIQWRQFHCLSIWTSRSPQPPPPPSSQTYRRRSATQESWSSAELAASEDPPPQRSPTSALAFKSSSPVETGQCIASTRACSSNIHF